MKIIEINKDIDRIRNMGGEVGLYMNSIVEKFLKSNHDIVESMKDADHNYSAEYPSSFHAEGDVWTHTMMVCEEAIKLRSPKEAALSALLHDIGKPPARVVLDDKKRVRFLGHEGISFYMAVSVLRETYGDDLTSEEMVMVLKLIACHSELFNWKGGAADDSIASRFAGQPEFLEQLSYQAMSDWNGRIATDHAGPPDLIALSKSISLLEKKELDIDAPTLTILIGPPASGKSTYIRDNLPDAAVVSRDDILMEITPGDTYNEKWESQDNEAIGRELEKRFQSASKSGEDIVIDMTNMSKKSRRRWLRGNWIKRNDYNTKAVVFATSYDSMVARNKDRSGKEISEGVVSRMMRSFCFPMADEFDDVSIVLEGVDGEFK